MNNATWRILASASLIGLGAFNHMIGRYDTGVTMMVAGVLILAIDSAVKDLLEHRDEAA